MGMRPRSCVLYGVQIDTSGLPESPDGHEEVIHDLLEGFRLNGSGHTVLHAQEVSESWFLTVSGSCEWMRGWGVEPVNLKPPTPEDLEILRRAVGVLGGAVPPGAREGWHLSADFD